MTVIGPNPVRIHLGSTAVGVMGMKPACAGSRARVM